MGTRPTVNPLLHDLFQGIFLDNGGIQWGIFFKKKGFIQWEVLKNGGHWVRRGEKRGSSSESVFEKGGQCVHAPPSPIFRKSPPPGHSSTCRGAPEGLQGKSSGAPNWRGGGVKGAIPTTLLQGTKISDSLGPRSVTSLDTPLVFFFHWRCCAVQRTNRKLTIMTILWAEPGSS